MTPYRYCLDVLLYYRWRQTVVPRVLAWVRERALEATSLEGFLVELNSRLSDPEDKVSWRVSPVPDVPHKVCFYVTQGFFETVLGRSRLFCLFLVGPQGQVRGGEGALALDLEFNLVHLLAGLPLKFDLTDEVSESEPKRIPRGRRSACNPLRTRRDYQAVTRRTFECILSDPQPT